MIETVSSSLGNGAESSLAELRRSLRTRNVGGSKCRNCERRAAQVEFSEFLRSEGYEIIPIPEEEQLTYGSVALAVQLAVQLVAAGSAAR